MHAGRTSARASCCSNLKRQVFFNAHKASECGGEPQRELQLTLGATGHATNTDSTQKANTPRAVASMRGHAGHAQHPAHSTPTKCIACMLVALYPSAVRLPVRRHQRQLVRPQQHRRGPTVRHLADLAALRAHALDDLRAASSRPGSRVSSALGQHEQREITALACIMLQVHMLSRGVAGGGKDRTEVRSWGIIAARHGAAVAPLRLLGMRGLCSHM